MVAFGAVLEKNHRRKAQRWYADRFYRNRVRTHRPRQLVLGRILFEILRPERVVDLGCGIGSYLEAALDCGAREVLGLEYSYLAVRPYIPPRVSSSVRAGDAGMPIEGLAGHFDCAISFEVAEHLPPSASPTFIRNLATLATANIVLTAAPPGQIGTGHINLRTRQFWIDGLAGEGWSVDEDLTHRVAGAWRTEPGRPRFRYLPRNLMIFRPS